MAERPGVLLYFDDVEAVASVLDDAELGLFLRGVMDYARFGIQPDYASPSVKMAFAMFRPRLDRDRDHYAEAILQRRHAVYCREAKKRGEEPLSFDVWKERELSTDNGRYPITTTTANTTTNTITNTTPAPTTTTRGTFTPAQDRNAELNDQRNAGILALLQAK